MAALGPLDLLLLFLFVSACVGGWRLGFVTRVASWIFMGAAMIISLNVLPLLLGWFPNLQTSSRLIVILMVVLIGTLFGQMLGLFVGEHLAKVVPEGRFKIIDRVFGAVAGSSAVIALSWLLLPLAADVPGFPSQQVRGSEVAQAIYDYTPDPPDASKTLRRLVNSTTFPSVFDDLTAAPQAGPPPATVPLDPSVIRRVSESTVKVEGVACRRTQDGSGFVVAPGLIVTNAHVVAGERQTEVHAPTGRRYDATVVYFDAARDLALLRVTNYPAVPLPILAARNGDLGAVFGHPGGQDELDIQPASVSEKVLAQGRDLYDKQVTKRQVLVLSATLRQGDSGGALVDTKGNVIGVAFAIAPDDRQTAYALDISELQAALSAPRGGAVSTGECLTS